MEINIVRLMNQMVDHVSGGINIRIRCLYVIVDNTDNRYKQYQQYKYY